MMDKQLANYFFQEACTAFGFLVDVYSFAPPELVIDDRINFAFVTFMNKSLAIELILDEHDNDIDCKVACVFNGKKTEHYALNDEGTRVRDSLTNVLRRRGTRDRFFKNVGDLSLHEKIKPTLADFSQMLIEYGKDILADSPKALS